MRWIFILSESLGSTDTLPQTSPRSSLFMSFASSRWYPMKRTGWTAWCCSDMRLCAETAAILVQFLSQFPSLEDASAGRIEGPYEIEYDELFHYQEDRCIGPQNHVGIFRNIITEACNAYRSGSFSSKMMLHGIVSSFDHHSPVSCPGYDDGHERRCPLCVDICRSFPLEHVVYMDTKSLYEDDSFNELIGSEPCNYSKMKGALCLSHEERIEIIACRPGGRDLLAK